jgi:HK97 family phage prohead protease
MPEEMKFATLTTEVRAAADADDRTLRFIGTTAARDRMGDEIPLSGWDFKAYRKNPVVQWAHDYSALPIGKATKIEKTEIGGGKQGWTFDVKFAPEEANPVAEQCYKLAKGGFLNAVSVGFQSHKSKWIEEEDEDKAQRMKEKPDQRPGKVFLKKELLELSLVPVPANAEALQVARKKGMQLPAELNAALDSIALERASEALANTRQIKAQLAALGGNEQMTSGYVHVEGTPVAPSAIGITGPYLESLYGNQSAVGNDVVWIGDLPETLSPTADTIITKPGWDDDPKATEIKYRVREPGAFQEGSFKRITLQKQKPRVIAVVGKLKGQDSLTIQALRFPRDDGWSIAKAKAWVKEHPDVVKTIDTHADGLELKSVSDWHILAEKVLAGREDDPLHEVSCAAESKEGLLYCLEEYAAEVRKELRDDAEDVALPEGETAEPAAESELDSDVKAEVRTTAADTSALLTDGTAEPGGDAPDSSSDAGGPAYIRFLPEDDPEDTLTILEG